ncbi:hypothetical protein M569_01816 [Genlisea aurea]|uniref:Major facilitator superfamily (MFS) profile domain-containing protein n=1 Tax=Genlisea aurea TaxID=192259 RepID=S8D0P2_9LAMI|nr:hypothetical protein M569_01816 [Genlisea aurea]
MHKRIASKDRLSDLERELSGKPSWVHSLPHVLVATISSFLFGYHLGVVNDTLETISVDLGFTGNTIAEGLVVSTCLGGAFLGSLFSGTISDGIGRRRAFQLCALPMIIGASLSATASCLGGMLLGRFLVGTGMGLGPPVAALYVSEVSPASVRGTYGSFPQIATCLGLMSALLIGIPTKDIDGWWRVCFWISAIPAGLLAFLMEFSAESPNWLFKKRRISETEEELEKLFGAVHVRSTMDDLSNSGGAGDEFNAQLSGINAIFYFSSAVFKTVGVASNIGNIFIGIVNISGSIIATILMDRLGRKLLLAWSFFGMGAAMGIQVGAGSSSVIGSVKLYMSVGSLLLFVLSFALGAGPVPSLLLSEVLPMRIRAKAMAVCMAVHWVINFFVGLLFLRVLESVGARIVYGVFGAWCCVGVVFVKRNVVETKGKSLQEIETSLMQ